MNRTLKALILSFAFLVWLSPYSLAVAATYYVSPTGNDVNPGSITQPFATLERAHNVVNSGDTIYMRGGTYTLRSQVTMTRSGSSGSRINVFNYPGETPVLDAKNLTNSGSSVIQGNSISWWHFKGLELKNGPANGMYLAGASTNNIIEFNNFHHNTRVQASGCGLLLDGTASNNLILNNDSHHNGVPGSSGGDGIGVNYTKATGNIVRGNRFWRNNDDGIDLWSAANVLVENNWSWENGYDDALAPTGGNGVGFKLGGGGTADGAHTVRNNVAWRNMSNGFDDNSADLPMNVYNNTSYENGGSNFSFYSPVTFVLKNNLSVPSADVFIRPPTVHTFNSWNLSISVSAADFLSLDDFTATGSRNSDGSLPSTNFLRLARGSDLIDKGTILGLAFVGIAPDLGAFEYSDFVLTLNAPTNLIVQP